MTGSNGSNGNGNVNSDANTNANSSGISNDSHGESSAREPRTSVNSGRITVDANSRPRIRAPRSIPGIMRPPFVLPSSLQHFCLLPISPVTFCIYAGHVGKKKVDMANLSISSAWITSYDDRHERPSEDQLELISPPPQSRLPQHNNTPSEPQSVKPQRRASRDGYIDWSTDPASDDDDSKKGKKKRFKKNSHSRGRKWDHLRSAEPVIITGDPQTPNSRWKDLMQSTQYGRTYEEESHVVSTSFLDELQPTFNQPFQMPKPSKKPKEKMTPIKFWKVLVQHPMVPLVLRVIVLITSIIALSLSVRIYELEHDQNRIESAERTQSLVAIVIDCLAIPYIGYMTWDEYTGQPLGLRSASQKASLVLMDLFFIIFKAASTALSFEALVYHTNHDDVTVHHSRALASFMFVGLAAWSFSFTVNVFRLVYKLDVSEDEIGSRWMIKSVESGFA